MAAICLSANGSAAQRFRQYDVSSGLSSNSVKGMIQDEKGYIWFATPDGLNVFNGKEFKSYGCSFQEDRKAGADAINILTILQHKDGHQIWAATHSSSIFLFNPAAESFKEISIRAAEGIPVPNVCYSMTYDNEGRLWIGTDTGIWIFNEESAAFSVFSTANSNIQSDLIQCLHRDEDGVVWVGTGKGLCRFNPAAKCFVAAIPDDDGYGHWSHKKELHISTITDGPSGNLWVGTWNDGLALYDKSTNVLHTMKPSGEPEAVSTMRIRSILVDNAEVLWLSANIGLFKYDILKNTLSRIILSTTWPNNNFYSSMKDREGGIWIGTFFQGAWYLSPKARQIECYTAENVEEHFNGSAVSSFCEDKSGNIYVASENGGLSLFNPSSKKFLPLNYHDLGRNLHDLCIVRDKLFAGTFSQGLKMVNLENGRVQSFTTDGFPELRSDNIFSLFGSENGDIYIGGEYGCAKYETGTGRFHQVKELQGEFIYDIERDGNGDMWFASYYNGIYRMNVSDGSWTHYMHEDDKDGTLPNSKTISLYVDDGGRLWICSEGGGVCRYDCEADCFHKFSIRLDDREIRLSLVYNILNDSEGKLWLTSNDGIYVCRDDGTVVQHLTQEDGLQSNQYNFGSSLRSKTGLMYFGGVYGFNVINPSHIKESGIRPFTTARIKYRNADGSNVSSGWESERCNMDLPAMVSSFSLEFECLSYVAPLKNRFAYRLDDDGEWMTTAESSVTFVNFPNGKHSIKVKSCNGEGCWSANEVDVIVNNIPPFHQSTTAKIIYILLSALIISGGIFLIIRRHDEQSRAKFREMKDAQDREAYQAKIDFFTYVAHEIKTPVSLIKAPLELVLQNEHLEDDRHNLEIMHKNTERLLNLVNQLLDFNKINSDGHRLKISACDPSKLILNVTNRFEGALSGEMVISVDVPSSEVRCMLDSEAWTKIVSNLVGNAVKHAEKHINVSLSITDSSMLHLDVRDDGCGIPEDEKGRIFDFFYQINNKANSMLSGGVGLGLSLVRLLVKKHNGVVYVNDGYKDGCSICVDIPLVPVQAEPISIPEPEICLEESARHNTKALNLLIVEDTADMLDFIAGVFRHSHNIHKAGNGQIALNILQTTDIDLIISDISMPVMNGFELLQAVRSNEMLCHIPVIMLTVESSLESKIKGLEYGADAYIEKPFSTDHLKATVDNLVTRLEDMRKRYMVNPLKNDSESIVASKDKQWFNNLVGLIQDNIQDTEISVEYLAQQVHMSRSSFQRKLKGLTGLSPVEFIRLIRLKKAAELLKTNDYRVNEVAFMVGFNKPSYFSSMFKKQFGMLPKDFISGTQTPHLTEGQPSSCSRNPCPQERHVPSAEEGNLRR